MNRIQQKHLLFLLCLFCALLLLFKKNVYASEYENPCGELLRILDSSDEKTRSETITKLGDMRCGEGISRIIEFLTKDNSPRVRSSCAWALMMIKDIFIIKKEGKIYYHDLYDEAISALLSSLKDEDKDVRVRSISALGRLKSERAVSDLLQLFKDADPEIRAKAIQAIGMIQPILTPEIKKALIDASNPEEEKEFFVRTMAKGVLLGGLEEKIEEKEKKIERQLTQNEKDAAKRYRERGIQYGERGHYKKAVKMFKKSLDIEPNNYETLYQLGYSYFNMKDYDSALKYFKRSWDEQPYTYAHEMLGFTYEMKRDYSAAEFWLQSLIILPDWPDTMRKSYAYYNMARIYSKKGDRDKAILHLKKAIELNSALKENALEDNDFISVSQDEEFKTLVKDIMEKK